MPPRNLKFFLEAALNNAPRPTSSSNTFCVPEDDSDAEEIPAVAPTSEETGPETTISFNQTLPKLHDIINLDEEQATDLKQHDTDISRACCPWEPEPVEDQVGQESDLDNVLSDSSDEGSDLENSQSASSDTSQSEAVTDQAKLVEQPENSINDISDEDHEQSDSDEAECIDPRILAQKTHTELSRCDKPVERLIGEKSSQHTSSTRPSFSQRFPPPESLYEINYHPRASLETENLSGSRGSIEQPPYFVPTVSSCHGYRDGPFSWSHQSFPNSFAPSSIFMPQSIPGPSVPISEESPPEWHDYANEKAIKKETIVGNPLPTLKRTASEMESSDTLQEVQTLEMAHSASAKPEIDAISQSQVVCAITSALSEAGEESESERPTKRVKHNSPPSTNLTRYTATAVISALLGGLGTIALLAALPAEYFQ